MMSYDRTNRILSSLKFSLNNVNMLLALICLDRNHFALVVADIKHQKIIAMDSNNNNIVCSERNKWMELLLLVSSVFWAFI